MKVLLANLGNRNIIYNGKTYNEFEFSNQKSTAYCSFLEWTKSLDQNYQNEKGSLDVNIINPIIAAKSNFDRIILYYSDQSKLSTRTDQDTIFEASIIENILLDKYDYSINQILKVAVKAKVIDNGGLLNFYRTELVKLKKEFENMHLTICDAGGTAQQKMALKVIAEFLLNPNQYDILYVERNELITDVNINEYRNVINSEQAITLIKRGEYLAAAELIDFNEIFNLHKAQKFNWKGKVFAHVVYRFYQNKKDAISILNGMPISNEILKQYLKGEAFSHNQEMADLFENDWVDITEKLYKSIFYLNIKNYTLSILSFSQFYEYFLEKVIPILVPSEVYGKINAQSSEQHYNFIQLFKDHYSSYLERRPEFRPKIDSVNTGIMVVKAIGEGSVKDFAKLISPYIDFTDDCKYVNPLLNVTRNQIAHQGKFITETDITKGMIYYPDVLMKAAKIFQLTKKDLFHDLNSLLENNLRN